MKKTKDALSDLLCLHSVDNRVENGGNKQVGVGQDDLCLHILAQVAVEDTFDGSSRTYGHKNRGLYVAVGSLDEACTGFTLWVVMLQCKFHSGAKVRIFQKNE